MKGETLIRFRAICPTTYFDKIYLSTVLLNIYVIWIFIFVVQILDFLNLIWPEIMNLLWNEFIIQRFSTSSFKQQALQSLYALNYDMPCHNNFSAELIHCSQSRSSCMKEVWDKCEIKCHDYVASLKSCVK